MSSDDTFAGTVKLCTAPVNANEHVPQLLEPALLVRPEGHGVGALAAVWQYELAGHSVGALAAAGQ